MDAKQKKRIYCAIYTRKSTSEGLDQDFTTLDAQRESAENYIASQKSEGWIALQEQYNDGGFTGANLERPALKKLLAAIKNHTADCVIVYKVDRLSRSLLDFSRLLEFFDQHNVTFVSVTQHFNTNSSMGRLTLNILLSFAQFERELISERTKDKMGAARKRGQWLGGRPPLGFDIDRENKRLVINPEESKLIKEIFDLYLKVKSLLQVAKLLNNKGTRTKYSIHKTGKSFGGKTFGVTHIQSIIRNVLYIGKVNYEGQIYNGQHEAIIDEETFNAAQETLKLNRRERKVTKNTECTGLLSKLLHCKTCNTLMFHTYTLKKDLRKYRYYLCTSAQKRGYATCPTRSINSQAIENAVLENLKIIFANKPDPQHPHKQEITALMSPVWETLYPEEKRRILRALLKRIDYNQESKQLGITLNENNQHFEFEVNLKKVRSLNKFNKVTKIKKEPTIRKNLLLAHHIQRLRDTGQIKSLQKASEWLNLRHIRIDQIMNMLLISPRIQEEILFFGIFKLNKIPEYKLRSIINQPDWQKQQELWQELLKA
ncbi:MAG: recombinase family protein [Candidatus Omnitrophota bacterium]